MRSKDAHNFKFQFTDFTDLVYDKIKNERYIAIMSSKCDDNFLRSGLIS